MARFDDVFARVIGEEGGYVNDPSDPGGETKFGISKGAYPQLDIAGLKLDDAKAIYLRDYWNPLQAEHLGSPLDEFLFDYAVNSGVARAAEALQRAVDAYPDGKIGPETMAAVQAHDTVAILRSVFVDRAMLFAMSRSVRHFGHGWFARLFDKTEIAVKGLP